MNELRLELADGKDRFSPLATLAGKAHWTLDRPPKSVEVRLYWRTEGKGIEDVETVSAVTFDRPEIREVRDFRFPLPAGPCSFTGHLVSLRWGLELVALPQKEAARVEFALGPEGRTLVLHKSDSGAP